MERKLASIQIIEKLEPIEGADAIEKATVLGWHLVVKKGEFKEGDHCIYCEVDSVLPDKPTFEFLRQRHFRIKTIKLRGQVSQGIAFPLTVLNDLYFPHELYGSYSVGEDMTDMMGIVKYEPYVPAQLRGQIKGSFPGFLHKTDETRIQSEPKVLLRHQGKKFFVTEKVDGSSMTIYLRLAEMGHEFGICSRNLDLKEDPDNSYWKVARALNLEQIMKDVTLQAKYELSDFAIQGELAGQGIQGNKYALEGLHFFVFNIYDIRNAVYLPGSKVYPFVREWGLKHVPLVEENFILPSTVDEMVEYSKGFSLLNKATLREGIVLRPHVEEHDEDLGRLSFKVINPVFLLRYEE